MHLFIVDIENLLLSRHGRVHLFNFKWHTCLIKLKVVEKKKKGHKNEKKKMLPNSTRILLFLMQKSIILHYSSD